LARHQQYGHIRAFGAKTPRQFDAVDSREDDGRQNKVKIAWSIEESQCLLRSLGGGRIVTKGEEDLDEVKPEVAMIVDDEHTGTLSDGITSHVCTLHCGPSRRLPNASW